MIQTAAMVLRGGTRLLAEVLGEDAPREARMLMSHVLGLESGMLTHSLSKIMTPQQVAELEHLIKRRAAREPMAHILGRRAFWKHEFKVTPDTLDPRPDTETLIEAALLGREPAKILDLGTGTGCILISLLSEWPNATGLGVEISENTLNVARENAENIGVSQRSEFLISDWFDGIKGTFDLIISNPPYIAAHEMAGLELEVRDYEPRGALVAAENGLAAYRAIALDAAKFLAPNGRILVEIGSTQAQAVAEIFAAHGFYAPKTFQDLGGHDRVLAWGN